MTDDPTMSSGQKNRATKGGGRWPVSVRQAALTGALAPLSRPFLPKRAICRSQFISIYEFMT